jgi:hypothetical protein
MAVKSSAEPGFVINEDTAVTRVVVHAGLVIVTKSATPPATPFIFPRSRHYVRR